MSDNSNKMTLEDKIVQRLKEEHLNALVDDEDALRTLTERAINEYLFKEKVSYSGYKTVVTPTPVMMAAERAASTIISNLVKDMCENPEIRDKLQQVILSAIPAMILSSMQSAFSNQFTDNVNSQIKYIQDTLTSNQTR